MFITDFLGLQEVLLGSLLAWFLASLSKLLSKSRLSLVAGILTNSLDFLANFRPQTRRVEVPGKLDGVGSGLKSTLTRLVDNNSSPEAVLVELAHDGFVEVVREHVTCDHSGQRGGVIVNRWNVSRSGSPSSVLTNFPEMVVQLRMKSHHDLRDWNLVAHHGDPQN